MKFTEDKELLQYRDMMTPPDEFVEGFSIRTVIGLVFVAIVMMPSAIYLQLTVGQSLGPAAVWVTVILFADLARRSFKPLRQQEIYMLVYVAGVMSWGGPFLESLYRQFLQQSAVAESFGVVLPEWVVPPQGSEALLKRTFYHPDWIKPIAVMLIAGLLGRFSWISTGYVLFRITSDIEKLPYPMAPVGAAGATALAQTGQETWRWRTFSIGAMFGFLFGVIYVFVPAVTVAAFGKPIHLLPIPWIDLTTRTESILPAASTGINTNVQLVIIGMVLPFWVVIGGFIAAGAHMFMNPILYKVGVLTTWRPGMDTIATEFVDSIDFWLSFLIGTSFAIAGIGLYQVLRNLAARKTEDTSDDPATMGSGAERERATLGTKGLPKGRGDVRLSVMVALFVIGQLGFIVMCFVLMKDLGFFSLVSFFLFFFAFVYTPFMSYVNARMAGLAGMQIRFPYVRETTFIFSGYKGIDIWFAPFPMQVFGHPAQMFREVELTGTKFTSIYKAEAATYPALFLFSFLFCSYIWSSGDPVPSAAYPWAQKMWVRRALQQCLWMSSTISGEESFLFEAIKMKVVAGGLSFGIISYVLLSMMGLPIMLLWGFIGGMAKLPHDQFPMLLGAVLGRYVFAPRFGGQQKWKRYTPVLAAGFACGMGLIGMAAISLRLLKSAVSTKPW